MSARSAISAPEYLNQGLLCHLSLVAPYGAQLGNAAQLLTAIWEGEVVLINVKRTVYRQVRQQSLLTRLQVSHPLIEVVLLERGEAAQVDVGGLKALSVPRPNPDDRRVVNIDHPLLPSFPVQMLEFAYSRVSRKVVALLGRGPLVGLLLLLLEQLRPEVRAPSIRCSIHEAVGSS